MGCLWDCDRAFVLLCLLRVTTLFFFFPSSSWGWRIYCIFEERKVEQLIFYVPEFAGRCKTILGWGLAGPTENTSGSCIWFIYLFINLEEESRAVSIFLEICSFGSRVIYNHPGLEISQMGKNINAAGIWRCSSRHFKYWRHYYNLIILQESTSILKKKDKYLNKIKVEFRLHMTHQRNTP